MSYHVDLKIPTAGGRSLGARCHEPVGLAKGQVVIHGATATPQRYYGSFARHLAWRGFRVLTYDYRGIGRSRDGTAAGDPVKMQDWIDDAAAAQAWLVEQDEALRLLTVGHSFGGQIAASLDAGRRPDALLLVGSQSGYWRLFPSHQRRRMWLTWSMLVPALTRALGYVPGWTGIGEDLPAGVAQQWARWCLSEDYFLDEAPALRSRLAAYDGRVLALSFSDDAFASRANVSWLLDRLERARLEHRRLRPSEVGLTKIGHFGFFRSTGADRLWPLGVQFLEDAAAGRVSTSWPPPSPLMLEVMADLEFGQT